MDKDTLYMQRAMELAENGIGTVSPNPLVGCVIVCNDKIIGEGYHRQYGGPHAEVNAVSAVQDKERLGESTVYVNLEPCAHQGKTPPCADLLVKHNVKKVVIANKDPNPLVAGQGIKKLKRAGIVVETGLLEKDGRTLNKRFFTWFEKKRPYIILKWAETADGFIAKEDYSSKWISNVYSRKLVHKWRAEEDAIMVGTNTALYDNPRLNVREWKGKDPLRVIVDRNLRLPTSLNLFDGSQSTICYNLQKEHREENLEWVKLGQGNGAFFDEIIADLYQRKVQSVMVEGGTGLFNLFLDKGLWDEARVFKSKTTFGKGILAPRLHGHLKATELIQGDRMFLYQHI